ncbi:MAG: hypothetical protein ACK559_19560, partial [bacterium]
SAALCGGVSVPGSQAAVRLVQPRVQENGCGTGFAAVTYGVNGFGPNGLAAPRHDFPTPQDAVSPMLAA